MNTRTADIASFVFVATVSIIAFAMYADLPDQIPSHWNASGEIDGYLPKPWGVIMMPLIAVSLWALFKIIPRISPQGFRTTAFRNVVNVFQVCMVGFLAAIGALILFAARGAEVHIDNVVPVGVGLLFIVLGNYLGKVRKNFFIGIRTPWTLASDEVWARTHHLGGWLFAFCGAVLIVAAFLPQRPMLLVALILLVAFIPVLYSYLLYRRLEGFSDEPGVSDDIHPG